MRIFSKLGNERGSGLLTAVMLIAVTGVVVFFFQRMMAHSVSRSNYKATNRRGHTIVDSTINLTRSVFEAQGECRNRENSRVDCPYIGLSTYFCEEDSDGKWSYNGDWYAIKSPPGNAIWSFDGSSFYVSVPHGYGLKPTDLDRLFRGQISHSGRAEISVVPTAPICEEVFTGQPHIVTGFVVKSTIEDISGIRKRSREALTGYSKVSRFSLPPPPSPWCEIEAPGWASSGSNVDVSIRMGGVADTLYIDVGAEAAKLVKTKTSSYVIYESTGTSSSQTIEIADPSRRIDDTIVDIFDDPVVFPEEADQITITASLTDVFGQSSTSCSVTVQNGSKPPTCDLNASVVDPGCTDCLTPSYSEFTGVVDSWDPIGPTSRICGVATGTYTFTGKVVGPAGEGTCSVEYEVLPEDLVGECAPETFDDEEEEEEEEDDPVIPEEQPFPVTEGYDEYGNPYQMVPDGNGGYREEPL